MKYAVVAASALCTLPVVVAWGSEGHETIAYVAQNFVTSEVKTQTQKILDDTSDDWLANVAAWADTYRYESAGEWSEPLHFIDAKDNPPTTCNVEYKRDCSDNMCVVGAIANYTQRVVDSSLSSSEIDEALKFIVHFVGDVHQPLHDENLEVGGNDIDVTFDGENTELHAVWDTSMIEKYAGSETLANAKTFSETIIKQIESGNLSTLAKTWTQGMNIKNANGTAMLWASDANGYVCTNVMPDGVDAVQNVDLGGAYYNTNMPIVDELLGRAGYRLAAWLNLIFTGSTGGL